MSSLARDSSTRAFVDLAGLLLGAVVAVITARWLGPSGKGIAATLGFLAMLMFRAASMGLGESAIVQVGRGSATAENAFRANVGAVLASGAVAALLTAGLAAALISPDSENLWLAVLVTAGSVQLGALREIFGHGLTMQNRIVESSMTVLTTAAVTAVGTFLFVVVIPLDVLGATLGILGGTIAGILLAAVRVRGNLVIRPRWDRAYLRSAVRYGLWLEASYLVTLMAGRVDLLLVFVLAGEAAAGNYSVALTVAGVVGLAPFALSYASFPRMAYSDENAARDLSLVIWRRGLIVAICSAAVLAAASPAVIPLLFGADFTPAVVPTLILLVGSICAGGQWLLARAIAARGDATLLLRSFATSLLVMVVLDAALIPLMGITGAAIASAISNLAGLYICLRRYLTSTRGWELIPRWPDCVGLVKGLVSLASGMRSRATPAR